MTMAQTILLLILFAALMRVPLPSSGRPRRDLALYLIVIAVIIFVLLTQRV